MFFLIFYVNLLKKFKFKSLILRLYSIINFNNKNIINLFNLIRNSNNKYYFKMQILNIIYKFFKIILEQYPKLEKEKNYFVDL